MENDEKIKNKKVETYAEDMAKAIDGSEGSFIRKIIEEQERNEKEGLNSSSENRKRIAFVIFSILLIGCAIGALVFLFFFRKEMSTVDIGAQFVPIIYLDGTTFKEVDELTKDQISESILKEVSVTEIKDGGVVGVYLTSSKKIVGLRQFLNLITSSLDKNKIGFVSDNFLIGATNIGNKNLFILLKMRSIADVFDTMRSWENKMFNDLHGFFGVNIDSETSYLLTKDFEDGFIQNKNARILRDNDGKIVMMYIFINDTSFIVTNNEASVREIMLRISSGIIRK